MLTDRQVRNFKKDGFFRDCKNLYLIVREEGKNRSWCFRYKSPISLKERRMGLGPYPDISLALAREKAVALRRLLLEKKDPLEERRLEELERKKTQGCTFEEVSKSYIESKFIQWKGGKDGTTCRKYQGQLSLHAYPLIGKKPIAEIEKQDILKILEPIIQKGQGKTALELRKYLKSILDYAKAHDWRDGDNPAEWKGNLDHILPNPSKIASVTPHKAIQYEKMPNFMKALMQSKGTAALAVRFAILNASRSGEARGARWEEIDLERALWTIPKERMKAGLEHFVTLSRPAIALLNEAKPLSNGAGLIFPNSRGKALSDIMLLKAVKTAGNLIDEADLTLHGLRATFRTWVGEETHYQREIAEHALSHVVGNKVERAYSRGTMEEKRRPLMEDWGRFCMGEKE
ncbi:DUF4102 domain-containing protein [Acetobacteraceae bacterium]|nr:DUF4102 domain-containing protein [Acetobacteraceae bacterium]